MLAYRFDDKDYFIGAEECFLDPLETKQQGEDIYLIPASCTTTAPNPIKEGYVQKWDGKVWNYVEDHVGEKGYIGKQPFEIKEYGPYPEGWSVTPPEPTEEELAEQARLEAEAKAEAQRVPDLEDAVMELAEVFTTETEDNSNAIVDLASYVAEMEARIAALEAAKERV